MHSSRLVIESFALRKSVSSPFALCCLNYTFFVFTTTRKKVNEVLLILPNPLHAQLLISYNNGSEG